MKTIETNTEYKAGPDFRVNPDHYGNGPWSLRFERDGTEDVAVISDAADAELVRSRPFWLPMVGDPVPETLTAMWLLAAAPSLLAALRRAEFLMSRVSDGDHRALENLPDAAGQARIAIARALGVLHATSSAVQITEDEFYVRFPLLTNHLNPKASWGSGEGGGCLFDEDGEEMEFVEQQNPRTVWTLVEDDDDDQYLVSGVRCGNRLGFLVSTVPLPEGLNIEVHLSSGNADDPESNHAVEA